MKVQTSMLCATDGTSALQFGGTAPFRVIAGGLDVHGPLADGSAATVISVSDNRGHDGALARSKSSLQRAHRAALMLFLAFSLFVAGAFGIASHASTVTTEQVRSSIVGEQITVAAGDTLYDIADCHGVEGLSTAQVIDWIREHSDFDGSLLQPGQRLTVPAVG